jgi:hypothetical protein
MIAALMRSARFIYRLPPRAATAASILNAPDLRRAGLEPQKTADLSPEFDCHKRGKGSERDIQSLESRPRRRLSHHIVHETSLLVVAWTIRPARHLHGVPKAAF